MADAGTDDGPDDWITPGAPAPAAPASGGSRMPADDGPDDWIVPGHAGGAARNEEIFADAESHTSVPGIAASISRGMAPYATGAGIGAGIGAGFGGIGAVPGAVAGAGAVALTDLGGAIYNPIARMAGWREMPGARDLTDAVLDQAGVRRPSTGTERVVEAGAGAGAGALGGAGMASQIGQRVISPVVRGVARRMAERPGLQAASGVLGGVAGQTAAEEGAGPLGQFAASAAAGALPFGAAGARGMAGADLRRGAAEARAAGYVLPPVEMSPDPAWPSRVLAKIGGATDVSRGAMAKNQEVSNRLGATALALPPDTVLTQQVYRDVRQEAGKAYAAVTAAVPTVSADAVYTREIAALGGLNGEAARIFPGIVNNPEISSLIHELNRVPNFTTEVGLEVVRELRFNANGNLRVAGDPSKHALGVAQRQAAGAIDDLIDRTVTGSGQPGVVDAYRNARRTIAMSYDLEGVTNPASGDVFAPGLARLAALGRPLSGPLRTIANAALAFPRAMQSPARSGHAEMGSAMDFFGAASEVARGRPGMGVIAAARGPARGAVLSNRYQNMMTNDRGNAPPLPMMTQPGASALVNPNDPGSRPDPVTPAPVMPEIAGPGPEYDALQPGARYRRPTDPAGSHRIKH